MSTIKPRTARVVIYQGDDLERLAEMDEAVTQAESEAKRVERNAAPRLMHEGDPIKDAQDAAVAKKAERDQFAAEAEERGVVVVLIARQRLRWRELMRDHPAREDNSDDAVFQVNMDTLPDVLLPESIDREMSTVEGDVNEFLNSLNDYDYYNRLFLAAWSLNRGAAVADPTQRLLSDSSQISVATSN